MFRGSFAKCAARTVKGSAAQRRARAGEDVAEALSAQIADSPAERTEPDFERTAINHRIGPANALEQLSAGPDIDHRMQPGGRALPVSGQHR